MSFHAYSKSQFKELNFDTSLYRMLEGNDSGAACARLDCKRWGSRCMFLYFTLDRGDKVVVPVFRQNPNGKPYLGFADIPIGAVVDLDFEGEVNGKKARLIYAEQLPGETDPARAMQKMLGDDPFVGTIRVLPVLRNNEHRLCADKAGSFSTQGAPPLEPQH